MFSAHFRTSGSPHCPTVWKYQKKEIITQISFYDLNSHIFWQGCSFGQKLQSVCLRLRVWMLESVCLYVWVWIRIANKCKKKKTVTNRHSLFSHAHHNTIINHKIINHNHKWPLHFKGTQSQVLPVTLSRSLHTKSLLRNRGKIWDLRLESRLDPPFHLVPSLLFKNLRKCHLICKSDTSFTSSSPLQGNSTTFSKFLHQ